MEEQYTSMKANAGSNPREKGGFESYYTLYFRMSTTLKTTKEKNPEWKSH